MGVANVAASNSQAFGEPTVAANTRPFAHLLLGGCVRLWLLQTRLAKPLKTPESPVTLSKVYKKSSWHPVFRILGPAKTRVLVVTIKPFTFVIFYLLRFAASQAHGRL